MPKEGVKGALAMASKVAANDARLLREMSKKQNKRKADEGEEEEAWEEGGGEGEEKDEEDDNDESPSYSEGERSSAESIKAHDLRKRIQMEELTLRQWEERLARLKQQNGKTSRAFVELQTSQNLDGEEED